MAVPKKASATKTYAGAGVDIDAGDALVDHLRAINPAIGGFSGLAALPRGMKQPRLVASTDGVGTKLLVAQLAGRHATIGIDLVAMVVNDIVVCGARPLFFLDYFATGKLKAGEAKEILGGIVEGCAQADCPLIGGETAEMPGMYGPGHYDLAGFAVGVVEADEVIDGARVAPGDVVLGLASSGLHSNGYSLAREVLVPKDEAAARKALRAKMWRGGPSLGEALLTPTRIYVRPILDLIKRFEIRAIAHITGGGIAGNLARVVPAGVRVCIDRGSWEPDPVFQMIADAGPVEREEMYRVFNMGVGMILIASPGEARKIARRAEKLGERCMAIGWADRAADPKAAGEVILVDRG